jgi:hypothetical protein
MDLASHQRILLGLIRSNYEVQPDDDDYFHRVARSPDLKEAQGNIFLWRVYVLERTCVLTTALLRQKRLLEPALQAYIRKHNVSPFREYQPLGFLGSLARHADPLVVSVSQFELALMKVREGDTGTYSIAWEVDPHAVLAWLARGEPLEMQPESGRYVTRVSRELFGLFEIDAG